MASVHAKFEQAQYAKVSSPRKVGGGPRAGSRRAVEVEGPVAALGFGAVAWEGDSLLSELELEEVSLFSATWATQ